MASAKSVSTWRMCRTIRPGSSSWARNDGIFGDGPVVVRSGQDRRLHRLDDRLVGRPLRQRRPEPVQAGVVVGEQQIVLGREVAVEGPQRHPGVGRDLLGRGVLDALREEPDHRRLPQRLAGALAARRLGRSDHGRKLPYGGYVNIDKTQIGRKTPQMVALLVHAILGIAVIVFIVKSNPAIFKRVPTGPQLSTMEIVLWVLGIVSLPLCWYFNIRYVHAVRTRTRYLGPAHLVGVHRYGLRESRVQFAGRRLHDHQRAPVAAVHHRRRPPARVQERPWLLLRVSPCSPVRVRAWPSTSRPSSGNAGTSSRRRRPNRWPDARLRRLTVGG